MFDKEYSFKGIHAEKVIRLTAQFDNNNSAKLFNRNIDVYVIAPLIGFLYGRRSELDKSNSDKTTKIFPHQLSNEFTNLKYNFQLIMLLDNKNEPSLDERINKAFRYYGDKSQPDEKLFEQYVLGGVDVLYDKLIENATLPDDYIKNLYDFMEEFDMRYNEAISMDSILELCKLARS